MLGAKPSTRDSADAQTSQLQLAESRELTKLVLLFFFTSSIVLGCKSPCLSWNFFFGSRNMEPDGSGMFLSGCARFHANLSRVVTHLEPVRCPRNIFLSRVGFGRSDLKLWPWILGDLHVSRVGTVPLCFGFQRETTRNHLLASPKKMESSG